MYIIVNISCAHLQIFIRNRFLLRDFLSEKYSFNIDGFFSNWLQIGFTNVCSYLWYMKKLVSCILTSALCRISQSNGNKHHFNVYFLDFSKVFFLLSWTIKISSSLNYLLMSFVLVFYSVLYFFLISNS